MNGPIRVGTVPDLISTVPFELGFTPRESIVVAALSARGRLLVTMRAGIDDLTSRIGGPIAAQIAATLSEAGTATAVAFAYTDAEPVAGGQIDNLAREAWRQLDDVLPVEMASTMVAQVGRTSFAELHGTTLGEVRSVSELTTSVLVAQHVAAGNAPAKSREDLGALPEVSARALEEAREAAAEIARSWARTTPGDLEDWYTHERDLWRDVLAAGGTADVDARTWGRLGETLQYGRMRDEVLALVVEKATGRFMGETYLECTTISSQLMLDPTGPRPDMAELTTCDKVLRTVAAHSTTGNAPALTLAAMGQWWAGTGAGAGVLLDQALAVDPSYRMATILSETLSKAVPPGWARANIDSQRQASTLRREPDRFLSIPDPADLFGMPIYEGDPIEAGNLLEDGVYRGTILDDMDDPDCVERAIVLRIHDGEVDIRDAPTTTTVPGASLPPSADLDSGLGL
ncbi:DUF4192 domain-containing protein [Sanguibacter massiliensis]|uniref:DUF4192 domain-containing protein n=1 Tax=Sanguibacter massiliensis TaxID=1973217 RepID=UPI000C81912B|nr:DUF4192 domain-containing protein [Sanguibacter massiliensis]